MTRFTLAACLLAAVPLPGMQAQPMTMQAANGVVIRIGAGQHMIVKVDAGKMLVDGVVNDTGGAPR
jgi:hypothetical protein